MKHFSLLFGFFNTDQRAIDSPKIYPLNWLAWVCAFISFLLSKPLTAATLPNGFSETRLATGLDPTSMDFAPDGRLFVTEKLGRVRIIKNGSLLPTPFLTISVNNFDERGLQSIAFDPDFANNQFVYVYYAVATTPIHNRVSRFKAVGDVADPRSETIILELDNVQASVHNGGAMFFKDGKLFITTGEDAIYENARNMNNLLGKVLRINPDGSIPTDNPFYNTNTGKNRAIWAYGLRHPFKATMQPGTGRIFIGDVGSGNYEEINEAFAGKNYGWPAVEGYRTNQAVPSDYQDPIYAYDHNTGCATTGGAFYNPSANQFPSSFVGKFFFADYCGGYIKTLDFSSGAVIANFANNINRPISVKVGPDGSMYYIARGGLGSGSTEDNTTSSEGEVWRIQYVGNNVPTISAQPSNQIAPVSSAVTFTVGASGTGISYQWQRNGVNISGATSSSYTRSPVVQSDNEAVFRVVVTNSSGSVTSNGATLTVTTNQNPSIQIITPAAGSIYRAGNTLSFSGSATDPEDGNNLPASAFQWRIEFHHDTHDHPGPTPNVSGDGKSGTFSIPAIGETSSNVWYRLFLTVTDSQGGSTTKYVDINPRVVNLTIATNPSGLQLNVDGQPHTTPYSKPYVTGISINLSAPATQTLNGVTYTFANWAPAISPDGQIFVPDDNTTYTATFTSTGGGNLRDPENPANALAGLNYQYYEGGWNNLPNFPALIPNKTGTASTIDLAPRSRDENYALRFEGYINVPTDGQYTFYTTSDDGSKLYIGSTQVVDNDGPHGDQERSGTIGLKAGKHAMSVAVFQGSG
ncbi:glucose/arabinose dehydrogenase, partial [Spirosoma sp. LMG 31448]|nr:glucose/arabinose dehydrogenase [Spirosoma utsteinense]